MPTAILTTATLEVIGKPKPSKHSDTDYRPVLFKLPSGETFWKSYSLDAHELVWLKKGETYQVAVSGDDYTIIEPAGTPDSSPAVQPAPSSPAPVPSTPPPSPTVANQGIPDATKRAIAPYAKDLAALYSYCYQQAVEAMPGADAETVRCAASAIFIACQRKFNLA